MINKVIGDFETRSEVSLKDLGAWAYSKHPSTHVLCFGWAQASEEPHLWVPTLADSGPPTEWLEIANDPNVIFEAHYAFFEWCIYNNVLVERHGWPYIPAERWRCSLSVCSYLALPAQLDKVNQVLGLTEHKDTEGHSVMMQLSKPRNPSKNNPRKFFHEQSKFEKLYSYCKQDVRAELCLSARIGMLPAPELAIWHLDQLINKRGVCCDVETIKAAIKINEYVTEHYLSELKKVTGGRIKKPRQIKALKEWLEKNGLFIENLQKETITETLKRTDLSDEVRYILFVCQELSRSSIAKYNKMLKMADTADSRIRGTLMYHGAHSGRWTGKDIQPQNYPRGTFKLKDEDNPNAPSEEEIVNLIRNHDVMGLARHGSVTEILSTMLRRMLVAAPGKKLIVSDYSQIEARLVMWLCGEAEGVELFKGELDPYKVMAAAIFGVPYEEVTKDQRFVGKEAILGLGYGMAWKKFQMRCAQKGVELSAKFCKKVVNKYRDTYKKVKRYWDQIETACIAAVQTGTEYTLGNVSAFIQDEFLKIKLPSGRLLSYYKPCLGPHKWDSSKLGLRYWGWSSQGKAWVQKELYGGLLLENIIQGIAGDLMRGAMLRLEPAGYPIVFTVHDEVVTEVPDTPEYSLDRVNHLMSVNPSWGTGVPIEAEGYEALRFRKD